ncbi:MAG: hypothetical protein ACI87J_001978 [Colwellia sp.]|jgi:hypothetical protein
MLEIQVTEQTLDRINALLSDTIMIFENSANSSLIIDLDEINFQKGEGNPHFFDELSTLISFDITDRYIVVIAGKVLSKSHFLHCSMKMQEFCMTDIIEYDTPNGVPEWEWVEAHATYQAIANDKYGVWDFVVNVDMVLEENDNIPEVLMPVLMGANQKSIKYIVFNQNT